MIGRFRTCAIVSLAATATAAGIAAAQESASLPPGRLLLELRPRYNFIDESDKPLDADGFTARVLAGWQGAAHPQLRLTLEMIHARPFARDDFNTNPADRASPYPLLPDPKHTGANRVHVDYTGIEGARIRAGRQVVRLGNQRWVSDNDFRQVPQLFDGVSVAYGGFSGMALEAGHFRRMRETSGTRRDLRLTTLEAAWNPAPGHALTAYAVLHDQPDHVGFTGFANESYRIVGARAEGTAFRANKLDFVYTAEYARQRPHAGGDGRIDADYWRLGGGVSTDAWTVRYDHELRGSNGGIYGLQAPLTDYYGWNGWSLAFFIPPREGLEDRWLTARASLGVVTLYAEAHRFRSDFGRFDLGRELDAGLTYGIRRDLVARLQYARYDPGSGTTDPAIRKTWLTVTYNY